MSIKIPLGTVQISPQAKNYLNEVLTSRRLTYGKYSRKFEQLFAKLHQAQTAIFCNSGTSALQVSLDALKILHQWQDGDEVIVPAVTFVATINVVIQAKLKPVLVDVDPLTFNLNPDLLEQAISPKTRAILVAHLFGQAADMTKIMGLTTRHRLKVIEDSCETVFATHRGKTVGSFGDVACFSTYAAHIITTGVGGLIVTSQNSIQTLARSLINHGRDPKYLNIDDDDQVEQTNFSAVMQDRFNFKYLGYSYRLGELEAALGLAQLEDYQANIHTRQRNAAYLTRHLACLSTQLQLPTIQATNDHVFMVYPVVLKNCQIKLDQLLFFLEAQGIETRYLLPIINQKIYQFLKWKPSDFPVAQALNQSAFYFGCHQDLKLKDLAYIVKQFKTFFNAKGV